MDENRQTAYGPESVKNDRLSARPRRVKTSRIVFYIGLVCLAVTALTAHFTRDFLNPVSEVLICTFGPASLIAMVTFRFMYRAGL